MRKEEKMGWIKRLIFNLVLKRRIIKMLDKLKDKLSGQKTYITAGLGALVAIVGFVAGPVDLPGGVEIPAMDAKTALEAVWVAAMAIFMRAGVKKG